MSTKLTHEQAAALRTCLAYGLDPTRLGLGAFAKWEDFNLVALTEAGHEALAEYDRENRTVLTSDLAMAADGLEHEIREYEARWDGYLDRIADYDEQRETLARLRAALEGK